MYARVSLANKDMEPELVCVDDQEKSAGFGALEGGYMVAVSTGLGSRGGLF